MGRSYRRMTLYRRETKWKRGSAKGVLHRHRLGESSGTEDGFEFRADAKCFQISSKDEGKMTHVTRAQNDEYENASSCILSQSGTLSDNLKFVGCESTVLGIPFLGSSQESRPGVIFVFEKASLVLAKLKNSYVIINPDEHAGFMRKHNLNRSDYRPDIIHEALVRVLGSRLNLCGGIEAVYVKTIQGCLIKINPNLDVPETLKGFCGMMSQLFQKLSIKGKCPSSSAKLIKMIRNPMTAHLPVGSHKIGLSSTSSKAVNLRKYFDTIGNEHRLVFVIGTMAHGKIDNGYTDDFIAVSGLPLSASLCVSRICDALAWQRRIQ